MTTDYIAFHAAERPSAVAIVVNGREISYAEFARDLRKMTRALREFALPRGAFVAIGVDDIYLRWLLRFAFERLVSSRSRASSGCIPYGCPEISIL